MLISESIAKAALTNPLLARQLSYAAHILNSEQHSVAVILGRQDAVREVFDGIDTLYIPSAISFIARKTESGVSIDEDI